MPPDGVNSCKVAACGAKPVAHRIKSRTHSGRGPGISAIGRAVHDVLPGAETASAFIHGGNEHRTEVPGLGRRWTGQRTGDLHVTKEGTGVELYRRAPGVAVVRVSNEEATSNAAADVVVVPGNVHAAVYGTEGIVVHPHRLTVIERVVVSAGSHRPGLAVGRGPQADALTTATGRQVARKPLAQLQVVNHDGITVVRAMPRIERRRLDFSERGTAIRREGHTGIAAAIVVVVVDYDGIVPSFGAVEYHAFALSAGAARGTATVADKNVRGLRLVAIHLISRALAYWPRDYSALHQDQAGALVILHHNRLRRNFRTVHTG